MNQQELKNLLEKFNTKKQTQITFTEFRITELGRNEAEIDIENQPRVVTAEWQNNYDSDLDKYRGFIKKVESLGRHSYIERLSITESNYDSERVIIHHGLTNEGKEMLKELKSPLEMK